MTRFQFVADHQDAFEVKRLCELVEVERSSYYAWKAAAAGRQARQAADTVLAEKIRAIHDADNTVGAPRVTAELNDGVAPEERLNHKRVARVMREHRIRGYAAPQLGKHFVETRLAVAPSDERDVVEPQVVAESLARQQLVALPAAQDRLDGIRGGRL